MNGSLSNSSVFGTDNYEAIQIQHEGMSWGKVLSEECEDVETEDVYVVDYLETCIDLVAAGFILVNKRVVKV